VTWLSPPRFSLPGIIFALTSSNLNKGGSVRRTDWIHASLTGYRIDTRFLGWRMEIGLKPLMRRIRREAKMKIGGERGIRTLGSV
jgi:hypothetical protein